MWNAAVPSLIACALIACASPAKPPVLETARQEPASVALCKTSSRVCDLIALAQRSDLDELAVTLYGDQGPSMLARLRARGREQLIVDPGVALHLDDVLRWAPNDPRHGGDPWAFRDAYARSLGTVRVYRGIAVTPEELAAIERDGILASSLRSGGEVAPTRLIDQLIGHFMGALAAHDTMVSVSTDPLISRCVAEMYRRGDPSKQVYVWAIDLPRLDLLSVPVPSVLCPAAAPGSLDCSPSKLLDEKMRNVVCHRFYEPDIEAFVQGRIDRHEIVSVKAEPDNGDCPDAMAHVSAQTRAIVEKADKLCLPGTAPVRRPAPSDPPTK